MDSVRANYPAIRSTDGRVRAAQAARTTAQAFGNPMIGYETDQTSLPGRRPLVGMSRQTMITATVPLEPLYQRGPRVARANAEVRAVEFDGIATRQQIGLNAAEAFYRVAMAQVEAETGQELVGWLDSVVAYNRPRVREGATSEADLIRSTIERDRVAAEAAMQRAELARARSDLRVFFPQAHASSVVQFDETPFAHTLVNSAAAVTDVELLQRASDRGEVRAARERVSATSSAIAIERTLTIRQVGATVGVMQSMNQTSLIAGVALPIPLFDRNRGEVQRAVAERDIARAELVAQERMVAAEARGAYDAAQILTERAIALTQRDSTNLLRRADESRRIALGAYREGAVPLLQVIDAARAWSDTRITYYRTLFAQQQSVLALLVAQGQDLFSVLPAVSPLRSSTR